MIIINAKLKIDGNKREDYLKLMKELVINSRKEEGNLFYHHYDKRFKHTINQITLKFLVIILVNI